MSVQAVDNFLLKTVPKSVGIRPQSVSVKKTLKVCLQELQAYINETVNEILKGNEFGEMEVLSWVFRNTIRVSEEEKYNRITLYAAKQVFNRMVQGIGEMPGGLNHRNIYLLHKHIIDFISDVSYYFEYFLKQTDSSYVFLSGDRTPIESSNGFFVTANNLFLNRPPKKDWIQYRINQGMVSTAIRQCIEMKLKRALGVYMISKVEARKEYPVSGYIEFVKSNGDIVVCREISWKTVMAIYSWSCTWIHDGRFALFWQNYLALKYLTPLFLSRQIVSQDQKEMRWSIHGSIIIQDYEEVKKRLVEHIGPDYEIVFLPPNMVEALVLD